MESQHLLVSQMKCTHVRRYLRQSSYAPVVDSFYEDLGAGTVMDKDDNKCRYIL